MKEAKKADRIFAIGFLSGMVVLYLILRVMGAFYLTSEEGGNPRYIHVAKGASAREIANRLVENGILRNRWYFLVGVKLMRTDKNLKYGDYELFTGMAPIVAIRKLTSGQGSVHRLTVPEGFTQEQIADRVQHDGLMSKQEFLAGSQNEELRTRLGVQSDTLEGFLFPDTYYVAAEETADGLVRMMAHRFEEVSRRESIASPVYGEYNLFDIVRIASIIEKEAFLDSEKPRIAGVIYNRLRKNMRLACDVTVQYGLYQGLPPGPICSPGRASLRAALHPETTNYLYFVSKNDGTHHFSETFAEHNRAVKLYQFNQ
jgi:UPF0755 protein